MDPLDQKLLHALCGQKFLPLGPKTDFFNSIGQQRPVSAFPENVCCALESGRLSRRP
jgi:hypothetical protein